MRGLLCGTTAKTNEEYKKVIKGRMNTMVLIGLIGAVTLTVALLAKYDWNIAIKEQMLGLYTGIGTGMIILAVILWIKNKIILSNEERLKESRLINSDERIQQISNKAFRAAALVMIVVMYGFALIGGLFDPVMVEILSFLVCLFCLAYTLFYHIYNKRM